MFLLTALKLPLPLAHLCIQCAYLVKDRLRNAVDGSGHGG